MGLKMDFYTITPGNCRAEIKLSSQYEGYPGVVHGGIIASILDETGGRAQMDNPDHFMVTAQLNVRYRKPVPTETQLVAIGIAGERSGRVSSAHSEIQNLDGDVLAEADIVLVDIPETQLADVNPETLGWRVYPDEEGS